MLRELDQNGSGVCKLLSYYVGRRIKKIVKLFSAKLLLRKRSRPWCPISGLSLIVSGEDESVPRDRKEARPP